MMRYRGFVGLGETKRDHAEDCAVCLNELDMESCQALERGVGEGSMKTAQDDK